MVIGWLSPASAAGRPFTGGSLHLGNAGTAMRPLVAALAIRAPAGAAYELRGTARMHERPIGDLVDALRALGCRIDYLGREGYPPLSIGAPSAVALVEEAPVRVRGDVSSQFLTSLLLALPLRASASPLTIEVDGELISRPYVEITLRLLERFGVTVERDGWRRFTLPGAASLRSPGTFAVEGDASSASYFVAAAAIAADAAGLCIEGVGSDSMQGDIAFVEAARAMGASIDASPGQLVVRRGRLPLLPISLDCNHMPDAAMTLAALALFAEGTSRLENIASWRVKETDRLAAMATELRKLGAVVDEGSDFLEITPPARWQPASIATYDDHRMAMAMSLAAFNAAAGISPAIPVRILDPRCVGKTWPEYFETLLGVCLDATQRHPRADDRRPDRLRQGDAGQRRRGRARLPPARFRRPVPGHRDCGHRRRRGLRQRRRPGDAGGGPGPALRRGGGPSSGRARSRRRCVARTSVRWRPGFPPGRGCALPCSTCRSTFAACPGSSPMAVTWEPWFSRTRSSRFSSPPALRNVRSGEPGNWKKWAFPLISTVFAPTSRAATHAT
jgi:3-phosphoshikimate 1-carboxyvinyltransferase